MDKKNNNNLEYLLELMKRYGLPLIISAIFLIQNNGLNRERRAMQEQYMKTLTANVKVIVIVDNQLELLNNNLETLQNKVDSINEDIKEIKIKMEFLDRLKK